MTKTQKILNVLKTQGVSAAEKFAESINMALFAVDVGPGSRVEVWNSSWTRKYETASHVSTYQK